MREEMTIREVHSALESISQSLIERDRSDTERRKVDDERYRTSKQERDELLERVNVHGRRQTELDTKWQAFFGDQGAFNFVLRQLKDQGAQNKWILGLIITTLIAVVVNLATKH